jgi:hypothetical protein
MLDISPLSTPLQSAFQGIYTRSAVSLHLGILSLTVTIPKQILSNARVQGPVAPFSSRSCAPSALRYILIPLRAGNNDDLGAESHMYTLAGPMDCVVFAVCATSCVFYHLRILRCCCCYAVSPVCSLVVAALVAITSWPRKAVMFCFLAPLIPCSIYIPFLLGFEQLPVFIWSVCAPAFWPLSTDGMEI